LKATVIISLGLIALFIFSTTQVATHIQLIGEDVSENSILKNVHSGNVTNLTIENISGGFGISAIIKNTGTVDFFDVVVTANITRNPFVRLRTTHFSIPQLLVNESTKFYLSLFGIGLGKFIPFPEITLLISTSNEVQKEVRIITKVLGPFTKIVGIYLEGDAFIDFTLFSPEYSTKTLLMNKHGEIVHTWESDFIQGLGVYLLENGNLLRTVLPYVNPVFISGGVTGGVQLFDWNGTLLWMFNYSNNQHCLHHNIKILQNGHILMIAWEYKSAAEAISAGRDPASLPVGELWPDHIIEVEPTSPTAGKIVWEWHIWDHLIQDFDATKENYGIVEQHPELLDINYGANEGKEQADWNHINSIDYNLKYDQILLSSHNQHEIWVIDHSTTSVEAAGHSGGNSGRGGDLLYRYGNPESYHAGNESDQKFFGQHDAQWISTGNPGEGNILVFNNGEGRPEGQYSSIEEFVPPIDDNGSYFLAPGSAYGPEKPVWRYTSENPFDFFAGYLSGIQRLPNGNTCICDGDHGIFFEVTVDGKTVWKYVNTIPNIVRNQVFDLQCYTPDYPGLRYLQY
jgi:hypothetical protein